MLMNIWDESFVDIQTRVRVCVYAIIFVCHIVMLRSNLCNNKSCVCVYRFLYEWVSPVKTWIIINNSRFPRCWIHVFLINVRTFKIYLENKTVALNALARGRAHAHTHSAEQFLFLELILFNRFRIIVNSIFKYCESIFFIWHLFRTLCCMLTVSHIVPLSGEVFVFWLVIAVAFSFNNNGILLAEEV